MLRSRLWFTVLVGAAVLTAFSTPAASAPIVFDFEDGLQGWELDGAATRVQTQLLGGEWAIFGDGVADKPTFISTVTDLTNVASISVEQFFVGDSASSTDFLMMSLLWLEPVGDPKFVGISGPLRDSPDHDANPSVRVREFTRCPELPFTGLHEIRIDWVFFPEPSLGDSVGFIDNITFHPIPEPVPRDLLSCAGSSSRSDRSPSTIP